jgi:hypothetical protein
VHEEGGGEEEEEEEILLFSKYLVDCIECSRIKEL